MIRKLIIGFTSIAVATSLSVAPALAEFTDKQFEEAFLKFVATEKGQEAIGTSIQEYSKKIQEKGQKEQEERQKAELENQFKNPVKIEQGASPSKGPDSAKVTVIEFSDFQCPYCKRGKETVDELLKAYPNDVRVVFKHLPLAFHPHAMPAAKAATAAQKQGKFWEMHDALFNNQEKLSDEFYEAKAKELGLDVVKFKADFADPATEAQVKADMEIAQKHGIQGTPGFLVGGVAVRGAYPIDYFKTIVDRHLGKTPAAAPAAAR